MDQLLVFLQDRWLVVLVVLVALFVIINVVKTVLKWVLVIAILAGLVYYGSTYSEQVKEIGDAVASGAKEAFEEMKAKALQALAQKGAVYKDNGDGTYTITAGTIRLDGKIGSDKVKITIAGVSAEIAIDDVLRAAIETAKTNSVSPAG
jgi:hypothetical protein